MKRHTTRKKNRRAKRESGHGRYYSKWQELQIRKQFAKSICRYLDDRIVKDLMNHVNKRLEQFRDSLLPWQIPIVFGTSTTMFEKDSKA